MFLMYTNNTVVLGLSKSNLFTYKFNEQIQLAGAVECPGYDTKQSDGEVPSVLELWRMRSTPSLPSLPGPLWPGVVAPDRALSMG